VEFIPGLRLAVLQPVAIRRPRWSRARVWPLGERACVPQWG